LTLKGLLGARKKGEVGWKREEEKRGYECIMNWTGFVERRARITSNTLAEGDFGEGRGDRQRGSCWPMVGRKERDGKSRFARGTGRVMGGEKTRDSGEGKVEQCVRSYIVPTSARNPPWRGPVLFAGRRKEHL